MRIPSGKTDQLIFFVAVDSTDLKTRETGLTTFTVYRSRNGGTATIYTTPTVAELSAANMPGVYSLVIDEDTTIASGSDSEEYCVHITQASMAPVTRTVELYRRDTTSGQTATVANGAIDADIERIQGTVVSTPATAGILDVNVKNIDNDAASASGTVTFPNATLASTTNITAGTVTTATNVTTVNGLAANVITATSIATDAITAGKIAADAIGASELAADAVTEIQAGLATSAALATAQADLDDIQTRLPAALVGGRIDANVGAISSDAVAADNAEAFFDGTGYAGTGNVIPTVTAVTGLTASNLDATISSRMAAYTQPAGFLAATFPSGTIANTTNITAGTITTTTNLTNLPSIPADWLTAAGTAADFTVEIQAGLATSAALTTAQADLDDIQTRLPAALVGGRMDASVGAMAANVITAAAAAADFGAEIADAVLDEAVDGAVTLRESQRLHNSVLGAKLSGAATTTNTIRDLADTKDRIVATVDADGNRTAVTRDLT